MRNKILSNINDPGKLEKIYRTNRAEFKREFSGMYPQLKGNELADFWHERLNYGSEDISWGSKEETLFIILASLLAGLISKLPSIFSINEDFFYPRNIGFLVFPFLVAYFAWKHQLALKKLTFIGGAVVLGLIYINLLPNIPNSDTLLLACIHLPLLLWFLLGISFAGQRLRDFNRRLDFLRFNGDLIVMSAVILLAGGLMTGLTIGLFELIGFQIGEFYFEYIVAFVLPAVPLVAGFLTQTNPQLVNKVSPVIARIFNPLMLVMLVIYLSTMVFSGQDPYNDREFLLLFNLLLIGVMALIFFSIADGSTKEIPIPERWILFLLSIVTLAVNAIALSAILFRIAEWGITPNRLAVLGGNILMLTHLLLVSLKLLKTLKQEGNLFKVGKAIVGYLPVYFVWVVAVVFLFPLLFGFK